MPRHRHRLLRALHASLMLVLVLCLAGQPLLAAVGEVHEATHHAAQAALHDDHAPAHDVTEAGSDQCREDGTLHLLLHYAHCCGHNVPLAAAASPALDAVPVDRQGLPPVMSHVASLRPNTPFRPPIQA
ncbi:hypothetical protein [Lysobacter niastensis]|uniref:DUF2946 domain-containing protein n=1 Tax=Lysobacter niastensis TaxID=380629 RepID=A0ABS0B1Y9_9GAMM|nr:hypothetical protein [Lysobacter niastensis]MBF6022496.1 hypothetical protein [Lysobacter niastensis]